MENKQNIFEYDEHSDTFVFDGSSITFTVKDALAMKLLKTKRIDIQGIKEADDYEIYNMACILVGNNHIDILTEEEFNLLKEVFK